MKIKYKRSAYQVPITNAIKIIVLEICLFLIRAFRYIKRLIVYFKDLLIVFVSLLLYILALYFINYTKSYLTLIDTIWDTRNTIFTLIGVAYFVNAYNKENDYHQKIRQRHELYTDIMFAYEEQIEYMFKLLNIEVLDADPLYTDKRYSRLIEQWETYTIKPIEELLLLVNNNIDEIRNTIEALNDITLAVINNQDVFCSIWCNSKTKEKFKYYFSALMATIRTLQKRTISSINTDNLAIFIKEFRHVISYAFNIIELMRKPWRICIDLKVNNKICSLLYLTNSQELKYDYYLSMLLDIDEPGDDEVYDDEYGE